MAENKRDEPRSTHVVYRIGQDFAYQETPCFCPARRAHSILDTLDLAGPIENPEGADQCPT